MKIEPKKISHLLFFFILLPLLSLVIAYFSNTVVQFFSKSYPSNWYFIFETLGVLGAYGLLYKLFDLYLWKYIPWNSFRVVEFPNLEGRWKGQIFTSYNNQSSPIEAILEIKQTFSEINVCMYMKKSHSFSLHSGFIKEEAGKSALHFEYINIPNTKAEDTMNPHFGTGNLTLQTNSDTLKGEYYNSPRFGRGHAGNYEFKFLDKKLKHSF